VPPEFGVHSRKHLLLSHAVPDDIQASAGVERTRFQRDESPRIVQAHDQVEHCMVQRSVALVELQRPQVAQPAAELGKLVAGIGVLAGDVLEQKLSRLDVGARERKVFHRDALF
jgi:hypothetical protein